MPDKTPIRVPALIPGRVVLTGRDSGRLLADPAYSSSVAYQGLGGSAGESPYWGDLTHFGSGTATSLSLTLPELMSSVRLTLTVLSVPSSQAITLGTDGDTSGYYGARYSIRDGAADTIVDDNNAAAWSIAVNRAATQALTIFITGHVVNSGTYVSVQTVGKRVSCMYGGAGDGVSSSGYFTSFQFAWGGSSLAYSWVGSAGP